VPGSGTTAVNVAFNFRVVDANGDGKISLTELMEYYRDYGNGPFQLSIASPTLFGSNELSEALFTLLDTNKDGKLSKDELAAAPKVLARLDLDENVLLTPEEIAPRVFGPVVANTGRVRPPGAAAPLADSVPFIVVGPESDRTRMARRLAQRYGRGGPLKRET